MKINNISTNLINNDDITSLLTIKKEKTIKQINKKVNNNESNSGDESDEIDKSDEYLDLEGEKKLVHYEQVKFYLDIM